MTASMILQRDRAICQISASLINSLYYFCIVNKYAIQLLTENAVKILMSDTQDVCGLKISGVWKHVIKELL